MPAAETIEVRLARTSDGLQLPGRVLAWTSTTVLVLIGLALSSITGVDFVSPSGSREVQLVRRSTGAIVVSGASPAFRSEPLAMVIGRDAERLDEVALLAKWGDPKAWDRLLALERY